MVKLFVNIYTFFSNPYITIFKETDCNYVLLLIQYLQAIWIWGIRKVKLEITPAWMVMWSWRGAVVWGRASLHTSIRAFFLTNLSTGKENLLSYSVSEYIFTSSPWILWSQHCWSCPAGNGQHQQHQAEPRAGTPSHVERRYWGSECNSGPLVNKHKPVMCGGNIWQDNMLNKGFILFLFCLFFRKTWTCIPEWSAESLYAGTHTACRHTIKPWAKRSRRRKKRRKGQKVRFTLMFFKQ